jgi:hypothetical protein
MRAEKWKQARKERQTRQKAAPVVEIRNSISNSVLMENAGRTQSRASSRKKEMEQNPNPAPTSSLSFFVLKSAESLCALSPN